MERFEMPVFGFDFGTTNSLASVVVGDRVVTFLESGQPIPSVVSYEGGKVEVGRKARDRLSGAGLGVQGSTVRSPKSLLGQDELVIDGVRRDSVEIVKHVLDYVRRFVLQSRVGRELNMDAVVATIPVNMNGERRALLRQAFLHAGMGVVQFVHEPLAALYGYLRTAENGNDLIKRYDGKLLLVFDWGGGTLDLTLCRVIDGLLVQVANDGTEEVGGDVFDEELRNEIERRSLVQRRLSEDFLLLPDARKRLLHASEEAKINLSSRGTWNVFLDNYYDVDGDTAIDVQLERDDLEKIVGNLVRKGVARIERMVEKAGYSPSSVALCLATGGMVNMPLVKNRLDELFGPMRVHVSERSASAIAEGAAWVANDEARLHLAKNIELVLARNSHLSLLRAGFEMPVEREVRKERYPLFCVDPTDGFGKFSIVSPNRPGPNVPAGDLRRTLGHLLVEVDSKAGPFRERLEIEASVDQDLILTVSAWSLNQKGHAEAKFYDIEFALAFPGTGNKWISAKPYNSTSKETDRHERGSLTMRSNVAATEDLSLVPGEVLYRFNQFYFRTEQNPPQIQVLEKLYYAPCSICGLRSNDPLCNCGSLLPPQIPSSNYGTRT
jgi:molecular chaperone DnaK